MKKYIAAGSIILLFTLINISTFFVGLSNTPPGTMFTGAVHYPPDYFYYLSLIAQGGTRWFSNTLLFNVETTLPQYVGWFYTLAGHLFLPIFRSQITIFHVLSVAGSVFYLTASYILIRKLLPNHQSLHILVFLLFLTSSTMPQLSNANNTWNMTYFSAWYNFGNPFERLTTLPHHLVYVGSVMTTLILSFAWWKTGKHPWRSIVALSLLGFIISSIQSAIWLVTTITLGVVGLTDGKKRLLPSLLPALAVGISGVPFVLYLKFYLYTLPAYNALVLWEPAMRVETTVLDYIRLNGPLVITAILGLPLWFGRMTREKFTLTFMAAFSLLMFFSRIPDRLSILNIRFLSVFPTLWYATVTGYAIVTLFTRYAKLRILLTLCTVFLLATAIPLGIDQLNARNYLFKPNNAWDYLSLDAYHTFEEAAKISDPSDVFLVFYPFDAAFPGLTGRRIYTSYANFMAKFNFEKKQKIVDALYNEMTPDTSKAALLRDSGITYIVSYTWITPFYSGLIPVYKNDLMTIYKVPDL